MPSLGIRGPASSQASADVTAFYPSDVSAWPGGELVEAGGRIAPTLSPFTIPAGSLPAGARTQPIVPKFLRRFGQVFNREHVVVTHTEPHGPIVAPVNSSLFQPLFIGPQLGYADTTGGGDWCWPARFSGLWARAGLVAVPNPGGMSAPPAPRWGYTWRVPRFSTLPTEVIPSA